jgi:hypothetical protein
MKKKFSLFLVLTMLILGINLMTLVNADGTATIKTDKTDYSPEETVTIFGRGFLANAEVTVTVTRPDGNVNPPAWTVTSDESGNFETAYLLDGILGTYTVVATDGVNTATTTFTDGRAVKFNETGLPIGTTWSVTLDGVTLSSTTTKVTDTIQFNNKDPGTYSFNIPPVSIGPGAQLAASPSSGTVEVPSSGSGAVDVGVTFST